MVQEEERQYSKRRGVLAIENAQRACKLTRRSPIAVALRRLQPQINGAIWRRIVFAIVRRASRQPNINWRYFSKQPNSSGLRS